MWIWNHTAQKQRIWEILRNNILFFYCWEQIRGSRTVILRTDSPNHHDTKKSVPKGAAHISKMYSFLLTRRYSRLLEKIPRWKWLTRDITMSGILCFLFLLQQFYRIPEMKIGGMKNSSYPEIRFQLDFF